MIEHSPPNDNQYTQNEKRTLYWDDTYAIAQRLRERHPEVNIEDVSIDTILRWTLELDEFQDDPEIVNDSILLAIYQEWFEEVFTI